MTISMSRIYPLKRKNPIGKERWYEKLSINYNGQLRNSITTKEDKLFKSSLIKDWKNGMQHKSDINATYNVFNYINISPNVSYTERWYTNKIDQAYNPDLSRLVPSDTTYGFYRIYNYSAAISASTTLYGMFEPVKFLRKITKMSRIRHRMDPSISFSATPDFGDLKYGFYNAYTFTHGENAMLPPGANPNVTSGTYSPFDGQLFGVPGRGQSGNISFSLDNNIEAKRPDKDDPLTEKTISLIDKLSGSISYNLVADSFNWSNLNTNMRLKWFKGYTINLNMVFDTYMYDYDEIKGNNNQVTIRPRRINKTRWEAGNGIGRLRSTGTSFSYTFNNGTFKKLFGGGDDTKNNKNGNDMTGEDEYDPFNPDDQYENEDEMAENKNKKNSRNKKKQIEGDYDSDGYYNNTVPWSFSFNYNLSVGYDNQKFDIEKKEYKYKLTHALSFNGNIQPTKNWRINFNATYDVERKKISHMTCNISRSMHCFQMTASAIPLGPLKSYSFSISANSSMLKDLKYDQRGSPYNNGTNLWY